MNVATPDVDQGQPVKAPVRPLDILSRGWSWLFLLVLIIFFSIFGQGFLNVYNFQTIGADMALVLIMALGQTFVIISGGIDLSTGFVMGMSSVTAALVMSNMGSRAPLPVVVLAGAEWSARPTGGTRFPGFARRRRSAGRCSRRRFPSR